MTTKIAIVGSGFGMYGLLPAFSDIKGCKVVSICGKNSERMLDYCKKLNLNQYTNWKEMLQKENHLVGIINLGNIINLDKNKIWENFHKV